MMQHSTHARIKGVSIWFYIVAAFQLFAGIMMWNTGSANPALAQAAIALAVVDIVIAALFVVFGYFAGQNQAWAFVAGLILYALRALLEFVQFFNPISLLIRAYLMFRIFQGLQACIAANQAERALRAMTSLPARRLEMPQTSSAPPPPAWTPARVAPQSRAEGDAS